MTVLETLHNLKTGAGMFLQGNISGIELANLADVFRKANAECESEPHSIRPNGMDGSDNAVILDKSERFQSKLTPTLHTCNDGCGPDFGRLTQGCPRCDELRAGAPTRSGRNARRF